MNTVAWTHSPMLRELAIGHYVVKKYRDRAAQAGVQTVALQLKKQGVSLEVAVLILAVR